MKSSKDNLIHGGKLNAKSGLLLFLINSITAFILNPILVNYFGTYLFGIWKSIDKYLGFASIADGKGSQALKWVVAKHESSKDIEQKQRFVGSAIIVWILFLPILISIISLFIHFSPVLISNIKPEDRELIVSIVILLGINLVITPLLNISESILVGTNRGYIVNIIKIFTLITIFILSLMVVFFKLELIYLAIVIVATTIFRGILYFIMAKKYVSWFGAKIPRATELKSFFKFSSWKLIWSFVARFLMASEVILLSALTNPSTVSSYIFSAYLVITSISISAVVTSSFNPAIGQMFGAKDYKSCQSVIENLREAIFAFSIFVGSIILLLDHSFVNLWAKEELFIGSYNTLLIILIMIELLLIRNESFIIDVSLDIKNKVLLGLLSTTLTILFATIGYNYIDSSVSTIFISILIARLPLLIIFPLMVNRIMKNNNTSIFPIKNIIFATAIIYISYTIGKNQIFDSWVSLIITGLLEGICLLSLIYISLLSPKNRKAITRKIGFNVH